MFDLFVKDRYPDFISWTRKLPIDTHISVVKSSVPEFVKVDWKNPKELGKGLLYPLKIKGHRIRNRERFLGFVDDLYSGELVIRK